MATIPTMPLIQAQQNQVSASSNSPFTPYHAPTVSSCGMLRWAVQPESGRWGDEKGKSRVGVTGFGASSLGAGGCHGCYN
eukprot:767104-Hanusia_phi.AAC.2